MRTLLEWADLFHEDGQTDVPILIAAFCNFADAHKNRLTDRGWSLLSLITQYNKCSLLYCYYERSHHNTSRASPYSGFINFSWLLFALAFYCPSVSHVVVFQFFCPKSTSSAALRPSRGWSNKHHPHHYITGTVCAKKSCLGTRTMAIPLVITTPIQRI